MPKSVCSWALEKAINEFNGFVTFLQQSCEMDSWQRKETPLCKHLGPSIKKKTALLEKLCQILIDAAGRCFCAVSQSEVSMAVVFPAPGVFPAKMEHLRM